MATATPISTFEAAKPHIMAAIDEVVTPFWDSFVYEATSAGDKITDLSQRLVKAIYDRNMLIRCSIAVNVLQKKGAGFHTSTSTLSDDSTDGTLTKQLDGKDAKLIITVSVFGT